MAQAGECCFAGMKPQSHEEEEEEVGGGGGGEEGRRKTRPDYLSSERIQKHLIKTFSRPKVIILNHS